MKLDWLNLCEGDWLYNPTSKRFCRIVKYDVINDEIKIVPLSDITKKHTVSRRMFPRYDFARATLSHDNRTQNVFFNVEGHGYVVAPEPLKSLSPGTMMPPELVPDRDKNQRFPMSPPGNSHAADAARYAGINVNAAPNVNPHLPCRHEWTPILLSFKTVYDCKKCGCKKEDS